MGLYNNSCSSFNNFLWSTNQTTPSITVTPSQSTTYSVSLDNGIGTCQDSVTVQVNNVQIDLGPDTLSICNQDSILLDAGSGYNYYNWSTGDSSQTIYASNSGTYSATVSNNNSERNSSSRIIWNKTSNDQPYTTGISLQKLDNGNLIVELQ